MRYLKHILIIAGSLFVLICVIALIGATLYRVLKSSTEFDVSIDKKEVLEDVNPLFLMSKDKSIRPIHLSAKQGGGEWHSFTVYDDKYLKQILSIGSIEAQRMIYSHKDIKDKYDLEKQKYIIHKINDKKIFNPPEWWIDVQNLEKFEYYRIQVPENKYIITFIIHDLKNHRLYCFRSRL
jgi:hypothetical protein